MQNANGPHFGSFCCTQSNMADVEIDALMAELPVDIESDEPDLDAACA